MNHCISVSLRRMLVATAVFSAPLITTIHAADQVEYNSHAPLKIPMVFRNGETHVRMVDSTNGVAISEGDIILSESTDFLSDTNERTIQGLSNQVYGTVWPNGLAPYRISDQLSNTAVTNVRSAVEHWNQTGAITLVELTQSNAAAYPDFIDFIDTQQCASWVGFQNTGAQSIYSGDQCSEGSMIHEIGHALGLLHEHTRADRDKYVQINWNNITEDKAHNFDVLENSTPLGEYDYLSIMHYGTQFFSDTGQDTITPLQNTNTKIGQREFLSDGDVTSIIELYQSEFSVVTTATDSVEADATMQLELYVTNNSDMGANKMLLHTTVPADSRLLSFSSSNWICQQTTDGADVVCETPALAENQSTAVSVSLSTPKTTGLISFDTTLSSNTFDSDSSNNTDQSITKVVLASNSTPAEPIITPQSEPAFAAATPAPSSGGGSFSLLGLFLILLRRNTQRRYNTSTASCSDVIQAY